MREPDKPQLTAGWIVTILTLIAYFSIGVFLTGEVALLFGVLFFVLLIWFLLYKLRYKRLGNLELVVRMYTDFTSTVERIKERVAEDEAPRRAAVSRRRRVVMDRESRRADRPKEVPVDRTYADIIERRVREAKANQDQSEGSNETET